MEIVRRSENGIPILVLTGRLNQASADALHAAAMEIAGGDTDRALIIDMGQPLFISSNDFVRSKGLGIHRQHLLKSNAQ